MWRDRVAIALLAVVVLTAHLTYQHYSAGDYFFPDSTTYIAPARGLLHGWGFASVEDEPETMRTPGYPVFLLPFLIRGAPAGTIVAVQHLLVALMAGAVFAFARRRGAKRFAALAAALVLAIDPLTLHYANKVLTETLSSIVLFATVALLLAALDRGDLRLFAVAGLTCGALTLVRPVAIALFIAVGAALALARVTWKAIAAFLIASLILPVAWAARNAHETGVFTVASIAGTNMLAYRAAGAVAIEDGGDFDQRLALRQQQLVAVVERRIREEEEVSDPYELPHAVMSSYYSALGRQVFFQHPRGAVLITLRGLFVNVTGTEWDAIEDVSDVDENLLEYGYAAILAATWVAMLAGVLVLYKRDPAAALLILFSTFYLLLMAAGGEAEARFRTPVVPLMALGAAFVGGRETASRSRLRLPSSQQRLQLVDARGTGAGIVSADQALLDEPRQ